MEKSIPVDDGLVERLVDMLKGSSPEAVERIIESAQAQLRESTVIYSSHDKLADLFQEQIDRLSACGCPCFFLDAFVVKKEQVISEAEKMEFLWGSIPFIPVIPMRLLGLFQQMKMVVCKGKTGMTCFDPDDLKNEIETPEEVYHIFDVRNGCWKETEEMIERGRGRFHLTGCEAIGLAIQTDIFSSGRGTYAAASCCRKDSRLVLRVHIQRVIDNRPELSWCPVFIAGERDNFPTCAKRI